MKVERINKETGEKESISVIEAVRKIQGYYTLKASEIIKDLENGVVFTTKGFIYKQKGGKK